MPYPAEYQNSSKEFADFLVSVKNNCMLGSSHQAYTTAQGVFLAFRKRISTSDAIRFVALLPVGLRALFVANWDPESEQHGFGSREEMMAEVRSLREPHNFSPDSAIEDVAQALRKHIDERAFDELLKSLPDGAIDFWSVVPSKDAEQGVAPNA